jgi:hypothetical protein
VRNFKYIAERAVCKLADEIAVYGNIEANWRVIDRIEKRWSIQGCADARIAAMRVKLHEAASRPPNYINQMTECGVTSPLSRVIRVF